MTSAPTSATLTALSFTTSQTFSGIGAADLKSNPTARSGLQSVIAKTAAMESSAGTPNVTITSVTEVARRNRNRALLSTTSGSSAKVTYIVIYTYDSAVTVAAETVRSTFITQLSTAIDDGSFVSSLQMVAASVFTSSVKTSSSDLSVGEVTVVVINRPMPTHSPVLRSSVGEKKFGNPGAIAGVVIGCCVISILVGWLIFSVSARRKEGNQWNHKYHIDNNDHMHLIHNSKILPSVEKTGGIEDFYDDDSDNGIGMGVSLDDIGVIRTKKKQNGPKRTHSSIFSKYRSTDHKNLLFFDIGGMSPTLSDQPVLIRTKSGNLNSMILGLDDRESLDEPDQPLDQHSPCSSRSGVSDTPDVAETPEGLALELIKPVRYPSFYL